MELTRPNNDHQAYSQADTTVPIENYDSDRFVGVRRVVATSAEMTFGQKYSGHPTRKEPKLDALTGSAVLLERFRNVQAEHLIFCLQMFGSSIILPFGLHCVESSPKKRTG